MSIRHQGTALLTTARLTLRRFRPEDETAVFSAWASDPRVTRYLNWKPHRNIDETRRVLSYWIDEYGSDAVYNWALDLDGTAVGNLCAVEMSERSEYVQIAYCLAAPLWGQGLATEAVRRALDFFLRDCGFHRVYARCAAVNTASCRVLEKCGMTREGLLRDHLIADGVRHDVAIYGILAGENR